MDHRRPHWPRHALLLILYLALLFDIGSATGVFRVQRKFSGRVHRIADLRAHDARRHGRILAGSSSGVVDVPIGGIGLPTDSGLYYAQIGIGTPSTTYYVQVDTGSDILWVNCITCTHCPKKSDIGIELKLYDPERSSSAKIVACDESFCYTTYGSDTPVCLRDAPCQYSVLYGDGSSTEGFFVTDNVQYDQVVANQHTITANASISFGCSSQQAGDLESPAEAVDGILGFGQSSSSMLSQLASAGKARKIFAHCLDTKMGGGIFAIGNVVQPKVKTTPLIPDMPHYNVNLKSIEVGGSFLKLPSVVFETGDKKGTIVDSGTTLAYLPEVAFKPLMNAIFSYQPGLTFHTVQGFLCFEFSGRIDDAFPKVGFQFEGSVELSVYPNEYFFPYGDDLWCNGFQSSALQSKDGENLFLLGDMVLTNKLMIYDLENQTIGWTEYNCSSSIQVEDDKTKAIYAINAHHLSSTNKPIIGILLLATSLMFHLLN
ncbi:hypothetical protein HPP92_024326 [Vanilla planifolia]|uniref:Peptidase A1 domain-containing protein n=1 Tax=Vanilla planifolia TaxID=51239 RepID=A0A835PPI5_VANPL|nr:hypothetical protein HPP92_024326 [Vanilla planifolia]